MGAALSRLECREDVHRHVGCALWAVLCARAAFASAVRLYGPLFVVTCVLHTSFRPSLAHIVAHALPATLRSSLFLGAWARACYALTR